MCLVSSSDIMSESVSLIIWPTIANYSLILLWFYVLCQKFQKCCNDISVLKRAYLYNHWFKSYKLKSIRKPRRHTLFHLYNAKCDSYAVKCYITSNPKLPNIAMLLEPTVCQLGKFVHLMWPNPRVTCLHNPCGIWMTSILPKWYGRPKITYLI